MCFKKIADNLLCCCTKKQYYQDDLAVCEVRGVNIIIYVQSINLYLEFSVILFFDHKFFFILILNCCYLLFATVIYFIWNFSYINSLSIMWI